MRGTLKERFEAKFTKGAEDECWEWAGSKDNRGYGRIGVDGRKGRPQLAHRISYQLYVGEIPAGLCTCHHCDNPSCVNPSHLFVGTNSDNQMDSVRKGRANRRGQKGERNVKAKLTEQDVLYIRSSADSLKSLSKKYNITPENVSLIRRRITWQHLKEGVHNVRN